MASSDPFAIADDGSAIDPKAFQEALKSSPERLEEVKEDPALAQELLSNDTDRMQAALKRAYAEFNRASEMDALAKLMSTERMRASCCVPRDPTALYKHMRKAGLEYGPKFRLLTEVFIQEEVAEEQDSF